MNSATTSTFPQCEQGITESLQLWGALLVVCFGLGARAGLPAKSIYDDAWILALGTVILLLGDPQHHISFI